MPRTQTIPNETILEATIEIVSRHGASRLTFGSLSAHVGLSQAALVQRFGTKQQLLAAVTRHCLQNMEPTFVAARGQYDSPLQAIYASFESLARAVTSVVEFANGQAFFYIALTDSDINALLRQSMLDARNQIRQLLDEAVKKEELIACDTAALSLLMQTCMKVRLRHGLCANKAHQRLG